ncbi:hypothetical protein QYF36_014368 [Acer negundo]|nr:hypothetical protein QYF36_014368 [Acer negundo]
MGSCANVDATFMDSNKSNYVMISMVGFFFEEERRGFAFSGHCLAAVTGIKIWRPPTLPFYKLNVDVALISVTKQIGVGVVVRNASSVIVLAAGLCFRRNFSVECAEKELLRRLGS